MQMTHKADLLTEQVVEKLWAAVLARTAIQRGGYSPTLVARDLTRMIIEWGRYEREYRAYKAEQDEEE